MISLILGDRCTGCEACVSACPSHVLDPSAKAGEPPRIARLDQCQTCYLCELYCPEDAIYVAPDQHTAETVDPDAVLASGHLGRLRRDQGWSMAEDPAPLDVYWRLGPLLGQGAEIAADRYRLEHPEWKRPPSPFSRSGR
jgi:NAD-dependent dihydropyrimidine dehydrogenase PreA subunit